MRERTEVRRVCKGTRFSAWAGIKVGLCLFAFNAEGQEDSAGLDQSALEEASRAALERVEQDRAARGAVGGNRGTPSAQFRKRSTLGTADPIYRNGVPYFEEWTIRAGALKLRVPGYPGWQGIRTNSDFYDLQARAGKPGEHLALAIANAQFVRSTRSKYVNYYGTIWVPQGTAFQLFSDEQFAEFRESLRLEIVASRKASVEREDFLDFQDYLDFKLGYDERVEESIDGYLFRAVEEEDMVVYFSTSEFVYQTPKTEIRQPMIMTMAYALVRGKLLRFDFKQLHLSDEDPVQLIAFTRQFIADMRELNGLGERRIR